METTIVLIAIGLVVAASLLAIKAFKSSGKKGFQPLNSNAFGEAAIQLLRDMRAAESINDKGRRIPRNIELIEERNRLLDCIDDQKRQQLIDEYSDSCA